LLFPAPPNLGVKIDDHSVDQPALVWREGVVLAALDQIGKRTFQVSRVAQHVPWGGGSS
jgi:hypothetical protein